MSAGMVLSQSVKQFKEVNIILDAETMTINELIKMQGGY